MRKFDRCFAVAIAIAMVFLANTVSAVFHPIPVRENQNAEFSTSKNSTVNSNALEGGLHDIPEKMKSQKVRSNFPDFWDSGSFVSSGYYNGIGKRSDFASADEDSMELVIGVNMAHPNAYNSLVDMVSSVWGEVVNTVSIKGEVIAIVADVPSNAISSLVKDVQTSGVAQYVEPNMKFQAQFIPNDPNWIYQWGPQKIEADYAWNTTTGNHSVTVAVIDTGIDYTHPDLSENYVALGRDWANDDDDPLDDNGHGTHCAGIVAAVLNNAVGIAGIANVSIMAEKGLDAYGWGSEDDLANAIIDAVDNGADILSNSWGGSGESILIYDAIRYACDNGVLVVAAAGNDATRNKLYPAAYDEVVAVTATDSSDYPASFTSFGDWVEVAAPGVDIYSTLPTYHVTLNDPPYSKNLNYDYLSGTSMACPHAAGVAALIWSQFPNATRDWVRAQLRYTGDDLGDPGFDEYYGYGRINAKNAVEQAPPEHDLLIFDWERPPFVKLGELTIFNVTVLNFGVNSEAGVEMYLQVNGSSVDSTSIALLLGGMLTTVGLSWDPATEGTYNVTCYVVPVPDETIIQNNLITEIITVVAPPPETNWMLLATDPDEGSGSNLKSIYGQTYSDIIYFKVEYHRSWTTIDNIDTAIFIDADQNADTGLPDETYPGQDIDIGADYVIVVGWEATEMWRWDPIVEWWDLSNPISLVYLDAPEDSDVFVVGVFLASVETEGIVDCAVCDVVSNWDWMPNSGYFTWIVIQYEHELAVLLETPQYLQPEENSLLNATVCNRGLNNETNVGIQLLINGTEVASEILDELVNGTYYTINYSWTPTEEGIYNITAYAPPVPSENFTINNINTKFVSVHYQLINPEPGQYANYTMNYYDSSGHLIGQQGYLNLTYEYYIEPYKIYITFWEKDPSGYIYTGWMIVNTMNRFVESGVWAGLWFPGWIETDINIGSSINILDGTATVSGTGIITVGSRAIDCWEIPYSMFGYPYTFWHDKASGLWIKMDSTNPSTGERMEILLIDTKIPIGTQYEHDLGVTLDSPLRLQPGETSMLNATVYNLGLNNETSVEIQTLINGTKVVGEVLDEIVNGTWHTISYSWTPTTEGIYNITAYASPVSGETVTINNVVSRMVRVHSVEVALISSYSELMTVTPILDSMGIGYDIYNDNNMYLYTEDLSLLLKYKAVIFYNRYRWITSTEYSTLESYLSSGGNLLVTGYDCLVGDTLLADLVRSSSTGDNVGEYELIVVNETHPIMNGPYGSFPAGYHIYGLYSDCDRAEADTTRGAITVAELWDGYDRIIATEGLSGKVVFWNGDGTYDWTWNSDCQAMFKNLIQWFTIRYITISINPSAGSPGTEVAVCGTKATANGTVSIYWDDFIIGNATANNIGDFAYLLTVPEDAIAGVHKITAVDIATGRAVSTFFKVILITVNPTKGPIGTKVTVSGTGFPPKSQVTVTLNDMQIGYADADSFGNFTFTFNIPLSTAEIQLIKTLDAEGNSAFATFTVVDVTPLDVNIDVGALHFMGEIAEFYAQTTFNGQAVNATITSTVLHKPDGTTEPLVALRIATGLYKVVYTISGNGTGTYTLVIVASYVTDTVQAHGTSFKCFLVSQELTNAVLTIQKISGDIVDIVIPNLGTIKANLTAINAQLITINGTVVWIQTNLGLAMTDIQTINATLLHVNGTTADINTTLGIIKNVNLADIQLKVTAINGTTVTIQSTLGAMNGTITSIKDNIATIDLGPLGQIEADISSIKGTQETWIVPQYAIVIIALIAAVSSTLSLIFIRRRKP